MVKRSVEAFQSYGASILCASEASLLHAVLFLAPKQLKTLPLVRFTS